MLKNNKRKQKSKVSQDQLDWLMMELESMREYNATLQHIKPSQAKSSRDNGTNSLS